MFVVELLFIVSFSWVFGIALLFLGSLPLALVPERLFLHEFLSTERSRVLVVDAMLFLVGSASYVLASLISGVWVRPWRIFW